MAAAAVLRRSMIVFGATFALVVLLVPLVASGSPRGVSVGQPSISRIYFGGKPTNPTITIDGSDLNYEGNQAVPPRNPPDTPSNQTLCPVKITGIPGWDYGTRLYFTDKSAKPVWSAGRYRPKLGELDCIGLIVTQYTSGRIEYHFGGFFKQRHYKVNPGDFAGVAVNGTGTGVHAKYGPYGVAPGS
jgi:hypothetical protein